MPNLLAIETNTHACSVALRVGEKTVSHFEVAPHQHTKRLIPMLESLLEVGQIQRTDVDLIAVSIGPGSFSGLRIGVSMAQGLAYALNIPVIPIETLPVLAQSAKFSDEILSCIACINARMGEVYWGHCVRDNAQSVWRLVSESRVSKPEAVAPFSDSKSALGLVVCGWTECSSELHHLAEGVKQVEFAYPTAEAVLDLAQVVEERNYVSASALQPLYVRNKVTHQA